MPEIDGWETSRIIKDLFDQKEIRKMPHIIAYSAFNSKEDIEKSSNSGMCEHISKPCEPLFLCKTINKWTNKSPVFQDEKL